MATKKSTKPAEVLEQQEPVVMEESFAAEEPAVEEPVAEEPVTEEPVAEEPVTEEPAAEEPVAPVPVPTQVIQTGKVESMLKVSTGSCADYPVRFPEPYDVGTEPDVVVGFLTNSTAARFGTCACGVLEGSVNNEGFTIRFFNGDTSSRIPHFSWIAFGTITK